MSRLDGSVGNQPGTIPGLGAVSNDDRLDVSDQRVWAGLGGSVDTEVVDRVKGNETRVRGLVDDGTGLGDFGPLWEEIGRKGNSRMSAIKVRETTSTSEIDGDSRPGW